MAERGAVVLLTSMFASYPSFTKKHHSFGFFVSTDAIFTFPLAHHMPRTTAMVSGRLKRAQPEA